jgi:hypothetical protein
LKEGEPVGLRLTRSLSSRTAHVGDRIDLELSKDIRVDDLLVAREGTVANGEVSLAEKSGHMGKGGDLAIRLIGVKVGDTQIRLRGTQGKEGDSKVGSAVALTLAFGVFGLMKHGKNAELPAGTLFTAYVAEDASVAVLSRPRPELTSGTVVAKMTRESEGEASAQQRSQPLDSSSLLQMKTGGLSDDLIVALAKKRGVTSFTPQDLIKMKAAGISDGSLSKLVELGVTP